MAGRPRAPLFQAFAPPESDVRDRCPRPRELGEQSTCVGWAVSGEDSQSRFMQWGDWILIGPQPVV